ncbi:MAG: metallopeptidase TldD-related protein [Chloroflexi bacterium]|nr:metallopeptidase TldD-related protein [Chloroflexota bacterium]MCY3589822.1 metallopeptidase TldD-related protein [Chloroflexota bacterium]MCY3685944.1 metallopeptidase TldD-related protein [Chloroflexota bacterium]MDE2709712.1 metallopeptidase TldD-related protein [Chloroflexota bacterium]
MSDTPADVIGFYSTQLGVDEAAAESVLASALGRGGSFAELYFEHKRSGSLSFEDQQVKSTQASLSQGVGIRVVEGDAIGYAYTEDLSLDAMRSAAATAAQIAHGGSGIEPVDVTADSYPADRYSIASPSTSTPLADKVELLRRADDAARAYHSSIARVDASMVDEEKRVLIVRSDGRMVADYQPLLRFNVSCLSEIDGERRNARWGGGGRMGMPYFDDHTPESLAEEAARQAVLQQEAREAPAGTFPVVLAAGDSGILLHEAVGHGLEADFNRKETSNYSNRIGESVASELVTVIDDATLNLSRGSVNIDDEGEVAGHNLLIENGQLAAYMQDRISSDHFGVTPSGNGRRQSFRHSPMPRMTNTYMTAGDDEPEDLIRRVEYGIYCKAFSGGQVNITNGDFVFSVTEGYLIENGQISAPIRDVNLIGNGPDVLSKVTGVGHDLEMSDGRWTCGKSGQSVPVGVGIPTVLVSGITVGGTQMRPGAGMSA